MSWQVGYLRPQSRHAHHPNLYFCGSSTHPGSGLPNVLVSSRVRRPPRPFPGGHLCILAEIYLRSAWSCHEILRRACRAQLAAEAILADAGMAPAPDHDPALINARYAPIPSKGFEAPPSNGVLGGWLCMLCVLLPLLLLLGAHTEVGESAVSWGQGTLATVGLPRLAVGATACIHIVPIGAHIRDIVIITD
eukprot:COSAG01_NODE_2607_length_7390_cov_77.965574_3_plen_192_part_00